jgi:hypothetical protein
METIMSGVGWFQNFSNYFSSTEKTTETSETAPPAPGSPPSKDSSIVSLGGSPNSSTYNVPSSFPDLQKYLMTPNGELIDEKVPLEMVGVNAAQLGSVVREIKSLVAASGMPSDQKSSLMSILKAVENAIKDLEAEIKKAEQVDADIRHRMIALAIAAADLAAAQYAMDSVTDGMTETEAEDFWRLMESTETLTGQMEMYRGYYNLIKEANAGELEIESVSAEWLKKMLEELEEQIKKMIADLVLKLDVVNIQELFAEDIQEVQSTLGELGFSPMIIQEVQDLLRRETINLYLNSSLTINQVAANIVGNEAFMSELFVKVAQDEISQKIMALLVTLNIGNISMHFMKGTNEEVMSNLGVLIANISASPILGQLLGIELSTHFRSPEYINNFVQALKEITEGNKDSTPTNFGKLLELAEEMAEESKDMIAEMVKNLAVLKKLLAMLLSGMPLQEIAKIAGMADTVKAVMSHMEHGESQGLAA